MEKPQKPKKKHYLALFIVFVVFLAGVFLAVYQFLQGFTTNDYYIAVKDTDTGHSYTAAITPSGDITFTDTPSATAATANTDTSVSTYTGTIDKEDLAQAKKLFDYFIKQYPSTSHHVNYNFYYEDQSDSKLLSKDDRKVIVPFTIALGHLARGDDDVEDYDVTSALDTQAKLGRYQIDELIKDLEL